MLRGANAKREQEYETLVDEFEKEGRYKGREEEVAARIVNKQRTEMGETQAAKEADRHGESPDRDLPIAHYDEKTIDEIERALSGLDEDELNAIYKYEKKHRGRKTLLETLEQQKAQ